MSVMLSEIRSEVQIRSEVLRKIIDGAAENQMVNVTTMFPTRWACLVNFSKKEYSGRLQKLDTDPRVVYD